MGVISKFNYYGEDKRDWEGKPISNINYKGQDYHFAERNIVTDGICENAVEEPLYDMQISGNSVQQTYTGKNLLNFKDIFIGDSFTSQGITYTKTDEGILVNGTSLNFAGTKTNIDLKPILKVGETYTISGDKDNVNVIFYSKTNDATDYSKTKTITGNEEQISAYLQVKPDVTVNNVLIEPQLELGTTATSYEPYVGGIASPNPEYPQEIESVGDKTKNLFNISKAENGTLNSSNGTDLSVENYPNRCRSDFIYLTAGSYVISFNKLISTGNYLHTYSSNNESSWLGSLYFSKSGSVSKFTLTKGCYIRFTIQPIDTTSDLVLNTETLKQYEPQLEKGTTTTEYEPYGYKVPVQITEGINLIPTDLKTTTSISTREFGKFTIYVTVHTATLYGTEANPLTTLLAGTYTFNGSSSDVKNIYAILIDDEGNAYYLYDGDTLTFTKDVILQSIKCTSQDFVAGKSYTWTAQINRVVTTNIYLNEQLRKAGDYIDYIDYKNKKVIRPMRRLIFDGTETFWVNQIVSGNQVVSMLKTSINTGSLTLPYTSNKFYCSHFNISTIINTVNIGQVYCGGNYINFNLDGVNNLTTFKEWLAEQYANGTPVVFEYPLATPIEESIELPDIQMTKGTNIFDVQTEIKPTALSVEYWKQI